MTSLLSSQVTNGVDPEAADAKSWREWKYKCRGNEKGLKPLFV